MLVEATGDETMLTKEEKEELRHEMSVARNECIPIVAAIRGLKAELKRQQDAHTFWRKKYEKADRKLAEDSKLQIIKGTGGQKKNSNELLNSLDKEGIMKLAKTLNVEIEEDTLK